MVPNTEKPGLPSPEFPHRADRQFRLLAPWWHTLLVAGLLLFASFGGTLGQHPLAQHSRLPQYLWNTSWELILVALTYAGVRRRITMRELIGGRWNNSEDFFLDVLIAGIFWLTVISVLGALGKLMHLADPAKLEGIRRQLKFLTPVSRTDLAAWFGLSMVAGFCEEIVFRGYLQRQLGAMTGSIFVGVLFSALLFGLSHGYEGLPRMVLIGVFGLMFGLLAWWRKSLRPGMIAHAFHDTVQGAILRMMK